MTPDEPLLDQEPQDPQSWNLYSYARNNPAINLDLDGRKCGKDDNGMPYDDGTGGGCSTAGVDANGNSTPYTVTVGLTDDQRIDLLFSMTYDAATNRQFYLDAGTDAILTYDGLKAAAEVPDLIEAGWAFLSKGQFDDAVINAVVQSSERADSPQISAGARAIAKKLGHASREGVTSAFDGTAATQQNARTLIRDIMSKPARVVRLAKYTDVYNAAGQGVRFENGSNRFVGFMEGAKLSPPIP
jgi:hypothetical protein